MVVLRSFQALKEKAELQAQLAALNTRLQAQEEHSHSSQRKQDALTSEVDTLKQSCWDLERAMSDLQNTLEAKNASLASSHHDLQVAEEQYQRLLAKVGEMQSSMLSKDSTGLCTIGLWSGPDGVHLRYLLQGPACVICMCRGCVPLWYVHWGGLGPGSGSDPVSRHFHSLHLQSPSAVGLELLLVPQNHRSSLKYVNTHLKFSCGSSWMPVGSPVE